MKTTLTRGNGRSLDTKRMHRIMLNLISVLGNCFYVFYPWIRIGNTIYCWAERKHTEMFGKKIKKKEKKENKAPVSCWTCFIYYVCVWPDRGEHWLWLCRCCQSEWVLAARKKQTFAKQMKLEQHKSLMVGQYRNGQIQRLIFHFIEKYYDRYLHASVGEAISYDSAIDWLNAINAS